MAENKQIKKSIYKIKIVEHLSAAHLIRNHPGKCSQLHGHNWKVEVKLVSHQLDHLDMVIDFADFKQIVRKQLELIDHRYLNQIKPFDKINPTAENVAKWLYQQLSGQLTTTNTSLKSVSLWETERHCVVYCEE